MYASENGDSLTCFNANDRVDGMCYDSWKSGNLIVNQYFTTLSMLELLLLFL
jgi:hypothetical protein